MDKLDILDFDVLEAHHSMVDVTYGESDMLFVLESQGKIIGILIEDKIDAINFTLSEKAIKDILSHSKQWGTLENKYQLIQFMEFYRYGLEYWMHLHNKSFVL